MGWCLRGRGPEGGGACGEVLVLDGAVPAAGCGAFDRAGHAGAGRKRGQYLREARTVPWILLAGKTKPTAAGAVGRAVKSGTFSR